jgi:hypothetical protein
MSTEDEHDASVELDYTHPQGEWTMEAGYKGGLRHLDQRYEVAHADAEPGDFSGPPAQSDALTFREQMHAGYGTLQRTVGPSTPRRDCGSSTPRRRSILRARPWTTAGTPTSSRAPASRTRWGRGAG